MVIGCAETLIQVGTAAIAGRVNAAIGVSPADLIRRNAARLFYADKRLDNQAGTALKDSCG
jgi:hypothetical protein